MEIIKPLEAYFKDFIQLIKEPLFSLGSTQITLLSILSILVSIALLIFLASRITKLLERKILPKYISNTALTSTISTLFKYTVLIIGLMIIFQSAGLNLSALSVLAGAIGVGIGFGLQNIANNFISGLIILFERPIKVGDRVEVGNIVGNVTTISARSTTVITNDNISVIVPNSQFIDNTVINWSHNDDKTRFRFPVGVSYNEDPGRIRTLLMEVARENKGVLSDPPPVVLFEGFGDSSLNFELMVWTSEYTNMPMILKSQLYFAIFEKFKQHQIEIPFPQRDLHLRSGFEQLGDQAK
jgi:small-conductance mechanosensitive channel